MEVQLQLKHLSPHFISHLYNSDSYCLEQKLSATWTILVSMMVPVNVTMATLRQAVGKTFVRVTEFVFPF